MNNRAKNSIISLKSKKTKKTKKGQIMDTTLERKLVSISPKRQITIPQKFFKKLGFTDEAECIMRGSEIVIRPAQKLTDGAFSEYILADLLQEGYAGDKLLEEFKIRYQGVRSAVDSMIADAEAVAEGNGEYVSYEDIFKEE